MGCLAGQRGQVLWAGLEQPCRLVLQKSRIAMNKVLLPTKERRL